MFVSDQNPFESSHFHALSFPIFPYYHGEKHPIITESSLNHHWIIPESSLNHLYQPYQPWIQHRIREPRLHVSAPAFHHGKSQASIIHGAHPNSDLALAPTWDDVLD